MSVRRSRTTRLAILGTIFVTVLVAGCATRDPSVVPSVTPTRSIGPVPTASVAPTRTLAPELDVDALPRASFDPVRLTADCAPESDLLQRDPPRRAIFCSDSRGDALSVGLAAIQTVVDGPIDRLYLEWPTCPATGCTDDDFQTATVVGWSNGNAYSTVVDARLLRCRSRHPKIRSSGLPSDHPRRLRSSDRRSRMHRLRSPIGPRIRSAVGRNSATPRRSTAASVTPSSLVDRPR